MLKWKIDKYGTNTIKVEKLFNKKYMYAYEISIIRKENLFYILNIKMYRYK